MVITDKVLTENGADFTFVCGKVPFAISCSSDLPHKSSNLIDLDLVNKMRIPLKNIRVTKMSILGHDLRCVGVVSQTIQCVVGGKISGTIHLYSKVVRDLFNSISTDCLASRQTYVRLMGGDPPEEPPDDPSMEVLGGDEVKEIRKLYYILSHKNNRIWQKRRKSNLIYRMPTPEFMMSSFCTCVSSSDTISAVNIIKFKLAIVV